MPEGLNGHATGGPVPVAGFRVVLDVTVNDAQTYEQAIAVAVNHLRSGAALQVMVENRATKEVQGFNVTEVEPTPPVEASQNRQVMARFLQVVDAGVIQTTTPEAVPVVQGIVQEMKKAVERKPLIVVVPG